MNQKKKLTLLLLTGISTLALCTFPSYAANGTITGITVRLREEPSTSAKILDNLDQDNKVEVIEKENDWYKISYKGKTGYVYGEYINVKDEEIKESSNTGAEENRQEETEEEKLDIELDKEYKIQENTKLYNLPLFSSGIGMDVKKVQSVKTLQILNNWVYVAGEDISGWIVKDKLQIEEKNDESKESINEEKEPEKEETQAKEQTNNNTQQIGYVNVEKANLRQKPTTESEHVETLNLNTEVTILGEDNNWYKVKAGDNEGYIYSKLVSDEKVKQTVSRLSEDRTNKTTDEETEETSLEIEEIPEENIEEDTSSSMVATGSSIIEYAKQYLGCKYVSGGNGPSSFDRSGFTSYVYKHFGYSLSRTSGGQASNGEEVSKDDLQKGDILVFLNDAKTKIGHVGIYMGNGMFIHAANAKRGVTTDSVSSSYYAPRYVTARRII